jgi:polyhydroxyalkanoate synthesis regulator phasin
MAKKQKKRSEQVRTAVDEAFQAAAGQAQVTRDRAQEVVDDLTHAAGRLRDVLEDMRPPSGDELRGLKTEITALRNEVKALGERVGKLEKKPAPRRATAAAKRKPAAKRTTSARTSSRAKPTTGS